MLGLALGGDRAGLDALRSRPGRARRGRSTCAAAAEALAERLTYVQTLVVSARGYAYAVARELALKLQEACYVTALGLSYADLEHGPIAVVDADTPALLIAAEHDTAMLAAMTALARRCAEDGGHVYGIGGDAEFAAACLAALPDPGLPAELVAFDAGRAGAAAGRGAGAGEGHRPRRAAGAAEGHADLG